MDNNLHTKIYQTLLTVSGITENNLFFLKSDVNVKVLPRYIFSSVIATQSYDTENRYDNELVQVSLFDNFKSGNLFVLRNQANAITSKMTMANLSNTGTNYISRCKLDNYRETELDGIIQIDLTFRINLTKQE